MKLWTILYLIFITTNMVLSAQAIKIGEKDSLFSKTLNETINFSIVLPSTYENYSKIKYPAIYVLDGEFLIQSTSGIIEYMSKTGQIPEMIEVYISSKDRTKDFTPTLTSINYEGEKDKSLENSGGGEVFLKFLNTELIEYIDQKYRTNSFNTFVGRSLAGLIGGFDYLQENTNLNSYLLIDPSFWWDKQYIVQLIDQIPSENIKKKKVYISSSDNFEFSNYIEGMRKSQESFYSKIKNKEMDSTKLKLEYFEQYTHGTVTIPSIHKGLEFLFNDYVLRGMKYKNPNEIINHFKQFSEDNGAEFTPLEGMINWLASIQNDKDKIEALKLYELNVNNYPTSVNALLNLGEKYEKLNMIEKAIVQYKNVLKIDENNATAIIKIKAFQK